jgi:hypothetical protein
VIEYAEKLDVRSSDIRRNVTLSPNWWFSNVLNESSDLKDRPPFRDILNFGRPAETVRARSRNFCARSMSAAKCAVVPDFFRRPSDGIIPSIVPCWGSTSGAFAPKRACQQTMISQSETDNVTVQISYPPNQINHQTKEHHKSADGRSYNFYMENHLYCSDAIMKAAVSGQQSVKSVVRNDRFAQIGRASANVSSNSTNKMPNAKKSKSD